jgi:hypothetical protein
MTAVPQAPSNEGDPQTGILVRLHNTDPAASTRTAEIFYDRKNSLQVILTNNRGIDLNLLGLQAGVDAVFIDIQLPFEIFSQADIAAIQQADDGKASWAFSCVSSLRGKRLRMTPQTDLIFKAGAALDFTLTEVQSSRHQPGLGPVLVKFGNVSGLDVNEIYVPLALHSYPSGVAENLKESLSCTLDSPLVLITSDLSKPVRNTLVVNIKNLTPGEPLVPDGKDWKGGSPVFNISFVYGNGIGALTPDIKLDKEHPQNTVDGARNMQVKIRQLYEDKWQVSSPQEEEALVWRVAPDPAKNREVLGFGNAANVDIEITDIVTRLAPGHTQMYIQYANFPGFRDGFFTLDLLKSFPAPRIEFFRAAESAIDIGQTTLLKWATLAVDRLVLEYTDEKGTVQKLSSQQGQIPLNDASQTAAPFSVSPKCQTTYTLNAYDADGKEILQSGQMETTVNVQWPENVRIQSFSATPNPFAERLDGSAVVVMLHWQIQGITPWHRIIVSPGNQLFSGGVTSTNVAVSRSEDCQLEIYDMRQNRLDQSTITVQSLRHCLLDKISGETYQTPGSFHMSGLGLAEGNDDEVKLYTMLSFHRTMTRDPAITHDESSDRKAPIYRAEYAVVFEGHFLGTPLRFSQVSGPYTVFGYDITFTIQEGPLAGKALTFCFNPLTWAIDPANVDPIFTPALSAQISAAISQAAGQVRHRANPMDYAEITREIADRVSALKTRPMNQH